MDKNCALTRERGGECVMSVRRSDWILLGADIGIEKYDDENYESYEKHDKHEQIGEMTYLIDSLGGEYFMVGKVIVKPSEYDGGFGVTKLEDLEITKDAKEEVRDFIFEKFGEKVDPKLYVVTHYE
jgi:hypothetical protein